MQLETKTVDARVTEVKADGTATALVSVFGNVDMGGDRVLPGAFTDTLAAWQAKGDPIPVIWSHDWDHPESYVGWADPAAIKETEQGLVVPMQFDLGRPRADQVHHLLKERRVTQFSFGYFVKDADVVEDPDFGQVRELKAVDLIEVGPTLIGMNPATSLLEAASALREKAGRVISGKNEQALAQARDLIDGVLSQLADQGKHTTPAAKAAADEVEVGLFAEWDGGGRTSRGRITEVHTDGLVKVPDTDLLIKGTEQDPALMLAVYRPSGDGFVDSSVRVAHLASSVRIIGDLPAPTGKSADLEDSPTVTGDTPPTIDLERLTALLARPRHQEEHHG